MKRDLLKDLKEEAKAMREGRSVIEEITGHEVEVEQAFVNVKISRNAFAQISKLAKKRKMGVGEIIEETFVHELAPHVS